MPKYIDKEKLLRDLRGVRDGLVSQGDPFLASVVTAAIGCVENQPSAEERRWIPVTERLPVSEDTYLVYTERGSVYASHFYTEKRFASGYVRESQWSHRGKVNVTHWMPLPEPPKEDA